MLEPASRTACLQEFSDDSRSRSVLVIQGYHSIYFITTHLCLPFIHRPCPESNYRNYLYYVPFECGGRGVSEGLGQRRERARERASDRAKSGGIFKIPRGDISILSVLFGIGEIAFALALQVMGLAVKCMPRASTFESVAHAKSKSSCSDRPAYRQSFAPSSCTPKPCGLEALALDQPRISLHTSHVSPQIGQQPAAGLGPFLGCWIENKIQHFAVHGGGAAPVADSECAGQELAAPSAAHSPPRPVSSAAPPTLCSGAFGPADAEAVPAAASPLAPAEGDVMSRVWANSACCPAPVSVA